MTDAGTQIHAVNGLTLAFDPATLDLAMIRRGRKTWATGGAMWRVLVVDESGHRAFLTSAHTHIAQLQPRGDGIRLLWRGVSDREFRCGPLDVTVDIHPHPDAPGLTRWRIDVVNLNPAWTVWEVEFPRVEGIKPSRAFGNDRQYVPCAWGSEFRGREMIDFTWRYPRGIYMAMGFVGYSRKGSTLYVGTHDPQQSPKVFDYSAPKVSGTHRRPGRIMVTQFPKGQSTGGCGFSQEYDAVVGVLDGDWYDLSRVYASWARVQSWACRPPSSIASEARVDREVHAWLRITIPDRPMDQWASRIERLAARLPVRLGVHVYQWHETPFDTNYPDYLPARKGFRQFVARVRKSGVVVMPYINARLWDTNAPSWAARKAERYAAVISGQRLAPKTLVEPLEEYGNGQKLAPMCTGTRFWRKTITEVCRRIVCDLGCDGVYLDQVGAEKPELCLNPEHGHPLGGGSWWLDGYRQMMRDIRRAVGPEPILTTECNWEGCVADYDALLIYHGFGPDKTVPMFPAVFSGLARAYGPGFSSADITRDGGEPFARKMGRYVAYGGQPGWGDLTVLADRGNAGVLAFFRRLCRLREKLADLFATGRMLRPPQVTAGAIGAQWQGARSDARTIVLINPTRKTVSTTIAVTAESTVPEASLKRRLAPFSACAIPLESPAPGCC